MLLRGRPRGAALDAPRASVPDSVLSLLRAITSDLLCLFLTMYTANVKCSDRVLLPVLLRGRPRSAALDAPRASMPDYVLSLLRAVTGYLLCLFSTVDTANIK